VFALGVVPALVQLAGLACALRSGDYGKLVGPAQLGWSDYRHLLGGGALMFVVNLQAVFWLSKDSLMIAHVLGLEQVGGYNTAFRIYLTVFSLLAGSLSAGLWPAYADAYARGDRAWIQRAIRRSLLIGGGGMLAFGVFFVPTGKALLTWYVGPALAVPWTQLLWLAFYFVILAINNMLGVLFAGVGRVALIAFGGLLGGVLTIPMGYFLMLKMGIIGLIIANCVCSLLFQLLPLAFAAAGGKWLSASRMG
jgi:O-antigen/teichoic acid export membrane protein